MEGLCEDAVGAGEDEVGCGVCVQARDTRARSVQSLWWRRLGLDLCACMRGEESEMGLKDRHIPKSGSAVHKYLRDTRIWGIYNLQHPSSLSGHFKK